MGTPPARGLSAASRRGWLAAVRPFDGAGVLTWLSARAVGGVEHVDAGVYSRVLRTASGPCVVAMTPHAGGVAVALEHGGDAMLAAAEAACRRVFDLDAQPDVHNAVLMRDPALAPLVAADPGMRATTLADPFECAVRAVLGQQISVAGARTLAASLVAACGEPLPDPGAGRLTHAFPTARALASADLSALGVPAARRATLRALARAVMDGELVLDTGPREDVDSAFLAIPGIGAWTAAYVALRGLGDRDAFPASDLGIRRGASICGLPADPRRLLERSQRWRPWRGYAAHHLWSAAGAAGRTRRR